MLVVLQMLSCTDAILVATCRRQGILHAETIDTLVKLLDNALQATALLKRVLILALHLFDKLGQRFFLKDRCVLTAKASLAWIVLQLQ